MNDFRTKKSLSPTRQLMQRGQRGRRSTVPLGVRTGVLPHWWGLLSLAACGSAGNGSPAATETPPTTTDSVTNADSTLDNALIYIVPEGALDGVDLAQIDLASLVLDGGGDTILINLGDLDASEVSIVTNDEGEQVFAVKRDAANEYASRNDFTVPTSFDLKAASPIIFINKQGQSAKIEAGEVIVQNAVILNPDSISVIKLLANVEGDKAHLAATTVDLREVFTSASAITFGAVDDESNAIVLSDKNGDGFTAEFSLDELGDSFGDSGIIKVFAQVADNSPVTITFSVDVLPGKIDSLFAGDGLTVTIADGTPNSASVIELPFNGGDGEITYALAGDNKDLGGFFILQGQLYFSAGASGAYTLVATDADGDQATLIIDFTIPKNKVSIENELVWFEHVGDDHFEVNLAGVFAGNGKLTLTPDYGTITDSTLTIDPGNLIHGNNTIRVKAENNSGHSATDSFVVAIDKTPVLVDHMLGSNATLLGTTLADEIKNNSFGEASSDLTSVDLDGGVGDDIISKNNLTAYRNLDLITFDGGAGAGDDTITSNWLHARVSLTKTTFASGDGNDIISNNKLIAGHTLDLITFDGGAGNDIISNNSFTAGSDVYFITFDGGVGDDTISNNTFTTDSNVYSITFDGGDGNDTISSNTLTTDSDLYFITFDGGDGNDTISSNTLTTDSNVYSITFDGGVGDDTFSNNTFTTDSNVYSITFDGGDGNDTISGNHFESSGTSSHHDIYDITLMGGAGDDVFKNNTATQDNGESASLTIDGGDGEDTVVFRLNADQYIGAATWLYGETITISGDRAAVTLIDIETLSFADGTAYYAADAIIEGNGGTTIDLASVFAEQVTSYTVPVGTVGDNSLTLAGSDFADGLSTLTVTATDSDGNTVEETVVLVSDKSPTIAASISDDDMRATNHSNTTIDLTTVFANGSGTLTYAVTAPKGEGGFSIANSALTIDCSTLGVGTHTFTATATDSDADLITYVFALEVLNYDSALNDNLRGSYAHLTGTTLDDAITDNSFSRNTLNKVDLDGRAGNDFISNNTLTASYDVHSITFSGGDGNDTISNNTLTASYDVYSITFSGGDGNDTISNNTLTADRDVHSITFSGGDGNDTISNNTLTTSYDVHSITFSGGDGNDTISDNHFESTGPQHYYDVYAVTLIGGAGDDVFKNNTATQTNGKSASLTIDGGVGEDTVMFRSVASEYAGLSDWLNFSDGGVTTITLTGDGAAVTLIDVETIAFADGAIYSAADAGVEGNGGILYDLASAFPDAETTYTYSTDSGTIGTGIGQGNTLTIAGTELGHGANTILITATDGDTKTTETITVNAIKALKIIGVKQHDEQTIDLDAIFVDANTYTSNTPVGINLSGSTLSFDNNVLSESTHFITITATDASNVVVGTHTLTYDLDAIKDQSGDGSITTYSGTTYADAIIGNSFSARTLTYVDLDGGDGNDTISNNTLTASYDIFSITFAGGDGNDTISNNTLTAGKYVDSIAFDGGDGNDTISNNTLIAGKYVDSITFDGGDGNDTISSNTLTAGDGFVGITFAGGDGNDTISDNHFKSPGKVFLFDAFRTTLMGGAGDDTISSNTLTADVDVINTTFAGGNGNDTISNNILTAGRVLYQIVFDGGAGNDTISNNTLTAGHIVVFTTFDGGDGDDTISDNHIESTGKQYNSDVHWFTLKGGAGDDVFRDNSVTQANGESASWIIDGGDGEDTVVFRSIADEYAGLSEWLNFSDGGVTTITLTGDGAAVTLIDVETISFADGTSYSAADAGVEGNGGVLYDLANAFLDADTTSTVYTTDSGIITGNTLTLVGTELAHGANIIVVTATANDTETIATITINAVKTLKINGAKQHDAQTIDLNAIFFDANTYAYTSTAQSGISLSGSILSFDNTALSEGSQFITITAIDGSVTLSHTLTYALDTIKDQTFSDGGSYSSYSGTTLADAITGNSFALTDNGLTNVDLDGGAGNDTISDNHFEASESHSHYWENVFAVTLMGGAGDDVFKNNTATQANGKSVYLTIDGGTGEDTVVFRSIADEYAGLSEWLNFSDGGVTTIILTGDGAFVTLINVETIAFADGASYSAADAWGKGDGEVLYDLANAFSDADTTFTAYSTASRTIIGNTLTLAGTELAHGANTMVITATAIDSAETIETITINVVKNMGIHGVKQHNSKIFDLGDVFIETTTTTYTAPTLPNGVTLGNGNLIFDNTVLSIGAQPVTITATDSDNAVTHTLIYALDAIKDQSGDGSHTTYTGTTLADAITGNSFAVTSWLTSVDLDGGDGNDTISNNTLTAGYDVRYITFDGGAGDDTISSNTLTASDNISDITFDGGASDDTISDNHFESSGTSSSIRVTLMGGAGDDVFSGNTATQANGERAGITIDGRTDTDGNDTDKVYFELASSMFTIEFYEGAYASYITVTDEAKRTEASDGVDSYAKYVLIDIEELYFSDSESKYEF